MGFILFMYFLWGLGMLKNKLLCGIACFAISFVSAMDNKKRLSALSFKEVKINSALFNNEEEKNKKVSAPQVTLIDENGCIPEETLPKMSIDSSALLSEYHLKALDNCHNYDNKNEILAVVKIIHGAPKAWQGLFLEQLGLKSKKSQKKFKSLPLGDALASLAETSELENGLLKKYTGDQLFGNLNRNELYVSNKLSRHFAQGHTSKKVNRLEYDIIAGLPEKVREEFHDNKQFFKVALMPSGSQQLLGILIQTIQYGLLGTGIFGPVVLAVDPLGETIIGPAVKEFTKKTAVKVGTSVAFGVLSGVAHRSGSKKVLDVVDAALLNNKNAVDGMFAIVTGMPGAYVEGFTNNYWIHPKLIANECNVKNFMPHLSKQILHGDTSLSPVGFKRALGKAINAAQSFGIFSAFVGFCHAVSKIDTPIAEEYISQL